METGRPQLSVVILCYRAEDLVPMFVSRVKNLLEERGLSYELVLVGNYHSSMKSLDRTPQIVEALAKSDSHVRAVVKEKQGMMGWDMRTGLDAATGEAVAVIDGDNQMPPEDIIKVYDALMSGNFDMAKTYRDTRHDGIKRIIISRVYNLFLKLLFPKVKVRDVNSKPKIFKREALQKLKLSSDDWFIDAEMIIKASYRGFSIAETATDFRANDRRASFVGTTTIFEFIKNLVSYRIKMFSKTIEGLK